MEKLCEFLNCLDFCIFESTHNFIEATDFVAISLIIIKTTNDLFSIKIAYPNETNKSFIFKDCTCEEIKNIIKDNIK